MSRGRAPCMVEPGPYHLRMDFRIRPAGPDDVETLRILVGEMGYDVTSEDLGTRLAAFPEADVVFIAESESGEGVGWIHGLVSHSLIVGPRVEIAGLSVAAQAQGQGVGTGLLQALEEWTARRGVRKVYLRSGAERTDAHAFYVSRGYQAVKTQLALSKSV